MTSIHEQDKKKGGRPPTGRVRKLSKSVTVKFSKPSNEALKLMARKVNRKLAEYIRESALNGEVVSGHNAETVAIAKKTYENSPHKFVDKWDTPILCIHGEKDYRINANQGMGAFNAARMRGIPAGFHCRQKQKPAEFCH